jgi:ribosomal subunit interface protein
MLITVKGKQLDVGDALRGHIETSLRVNVEKYFANALESHVVLTREAHLFRADVSVHVGRGILVQGQASDADAYVASDTAIQHVTKRLRRYKRRLRDHHKDKVDAIPAQAYVIAQHDDEEQEDHAIVNGAAQPMIVAEMTTEIPTLSVSDAVMRLDLGDLPALLFKHAGHGGINLIYRRADGHIGWIDPQGNGNNPGSHPHGIPQGAPAITGSTR